MRQRIAWQIPEHLFLAKARRGRSSLLRLFAWLTIISAVAGVLTAIVVQYGIPGLPPHVYSVLWIGALSISAYTIAGYGLLHVVTLNRIRKPEGRVKHAVSSQGISRTDTIWPWKRFAAFDIEPHPEDPESRDIIFYGHSGIHARLTLPGNERDDLIIRFVAKHLPLVDEVSDPNTVMSKAVRPPIWMRWLMGGLNIFYGITIGYFLVRRTHKDLIDVFLYGVIIVNPATVACAVGGWTGWLRRERINYGLWLISFSVLSLLSLIIGVILSIW